MSASDNQSGQDKKYDFVTGEEFEDKLFAQELEHIGKQHEAEVDKTKLFGLAFSGGGIRSATFSLGIMQALAEMGWLKKMHYLSTVSGGSYIGASLTWLLHRLWKTNNKEISFNTDEAFPYQRNHADNKNDEAVNHAYSLTCHLRQHAEYLKPGGGITIWSLIAVVLRGSLLSLLVYIPPLMFVLAAGITIGLFGDVSPHIGLIDVSASQHSGDIALYQMLQHASFLGDIARWKIQVAGSSYTFAFNPVLCMAATLLLLAAVGAVAYGFITAAHLIGKRAYQWRRRYETYAGVSLKLFLALLALGFLPVIAGLLGNMQNEIASSLSISGAIASMLAIVKGNSGKKSRLPIGVIAPVALLLLVYGIVLLLFVQAVAWHGNFVFWALLAGFLILSWLLGKKVNINYISIHRYYRDRLMELFLPDVGDVLAHTAPQAANGANEIGIDKMCDYDAQANGPYHLINCNMVTTGSRQPKLKARGGENFVLSPLYCGSKATGWRRSKDYMHGGMNLATAMAVSGAAADPHGAPGGEGLLRNPSLSLLMALLNVRLGYWAPHPKRCDYATPNWFGQGWHELTGSHMDEKADFVHLADGGHFENLALYELVRRKVKTIIVCDGAADTDFSFADFGNFVEKVRIDFGADIDMPSFLSLCPKPDLDEHGNKTHPYSIDLAEQGYLIGDIMYNNGSKGMLIYIKTTMIGHLPKDLYSYHNAHPAFPDETTGDQFFDEKQFEAYRELGYRIGFSLSEHAKVKAVFEPKKKTD